MLEATPECGKEFAAAVRHVLSWEDAWAAWKRANCPDLSRPAAKMPPGAPTAAELGERRSCRPAAPATYV